MAAPKREHLAADATRFLAAGAVNTGLTSAIYLALLMFTSPSVAYAIAWLVGLGFVMIVYPDRVFVGGARSAKARIALGATTIAVFLAGLLTLRMLVALTEAPRLSFFATLAFTTLLNFVAGRILLRKGGVNARQG